MSEDGWIEWKGGKCPVGADAQGWAQFRCEDRPEAEQGGPQPLANLRWSRTGGAGDIIAYRIAQP